MKAPLNKESYVIKSKKAMLLSLAVVICLGASIQAATPAPVPSPSPSPLPQYTVHGTVQDTEGYSVPYASVRVTWEEDTYRPGFYASTDVNGRYSVTLEGAHPSALVEAWANGFLLKPKAIVIRGSNTNAGNIVLTRGLYVSVWSQFSGTTLYWWTLVCAQASVEKVNVTAVIGGPGSQPWMEIPATTLSGTIRPWQCVQVPNSIVVPTTTPRKSSYCGEVTVSRVASPSPFTARNSWTGFCQSYGVDAFGKPLRPELYNDRAQYEARVQGLKAQRVSSTDDPQ